MVEVTIDVDGKGNVTVEGHGFSGTDCKAVTAAIEQALGEATSVKLKPEYRQAKPQMRKAGA